MSLLQSTKHNSDISYCFDELVQSLIMCLDKGGALQKILGRIPAKRKFREQYQLTAGLHSGFNPIIYQTDIMIKIANNGIYLDKCYFH
jgi:hypothetical protein